MEGKLDIHVNLIALADGAGLDSVGRTGFTFCDYDGRPGSRVTGDSAFAAAGPLAVAIVSLAGEDIWEGCEKGEGGGEEV